MYLHVRNYLRVIAFSEVAKNNAEIRTNKRSEREPVCARDFGNTAMPY